MSPSSRRAWIEIKVSGFPPCRCCVALLAEGVDRNQKDPSTMVLVGQVALLAEGVDRNIRAHHYSGKVVSRPPRGGRG